MIKVNKYVWVGGKVGRREALETDSRVPGAHKVEELIAILADEGLDVVAGHVVPFHTIVVEVVQDGQTRLFVTLEKQ